MAEGRDGYPDQTNPDAARHARPKRNSNERLRLASLNIRGMGSSATNGINDKWLRVNQIMKEKRLAILAVQETHLSNENTAALNTLFEQSLTIYTSVDPQTPCAARGVAFVVNKRMLNARDIKIKEIIPGRAQTLSLPQPSGDDLVLLNVYAPNDTAQNADFWRRLTELRDAQQLDNPDAVMGDFNIVEDTLDRIPARGDRRDPVSALAALMRKINMVDGWRIENPSTRAFTFLQESTMSQSRIDRIYVREDINGKTADWDIVASGIRTDHQMITMSLANYAAPYVGKGRWTLAKVLLNDQLFMDNLVRTERETLNEIRALATRSDERNAQTLYSDFKAQIMNSARRRTKVLYAKWDRRSRNLKTAMLEVLNGSEPGSGPRLNEDQAKETAALLQNKLTKLEMKRFEERRENEKMKQWIQGETMSRSW
ncbi:Endonuclease/exonuclease/phosphatase, partial [Lenzites betulinus]